VYCVNTQKVSTFFFKEMAISALSASQVILETILAQSTAYNKTRTGENVTEIEDLFFETLNRIKMRG
jgi:hypothetical protein